MTGIGYHVTSPPRRQRFRTLSRREITPQRSYPTTYSIHLQVSTSSTSIQHSTQSSNLEQFASHLAPDPLTLKLLL